MAKKLAIPKKGDLVISIKEDRMGCYSPYELIHKGEIGVVVFARHEINSTGHLTIKWLNCKTSKFYLDDQWANRAMGWKKCLRVLQ